MAGNATEPKSGYDIPLYGIENELYFYALHISALVCIVASFVCAIIAIVLSFRTRNYRQFYRTWTKSERFIVYLAICDALFNVSHSADHLHIVIYREMVHPKEVCEFLGFLLVEFANVQNLMVNCIAINAFLLIIYEKHLNFGKWDWRMLLWTFGAPFVAATVSAACGKLGPNGVFCVFDAVKGASVYIVFIMLSCVVVLVVNVILYFLTWKRIRDQTNLTMHMKIGKKRKASYRAAKAMFLFVASFVVRWWAIALYGAWTLTGEVPPSVMFVASTFTNIGGVLNLAVYKIMRYKGFTRDQSDVDGSNEADSIPTGSKLDVQLMGFNKT